jgi:hypothetical protein
MPSGYTTMPLAKKLGIKPGYKILLHNQPEHYFELFEDLPQDLEVINDPVSEGIDFIHLFCTQFSDLIKQMDVLRPALKKTGLMWISWPKGSSKVPTDLMRDPIREYLLGVGLVDVKVAAVDEVWSGLKFVYRLKDRL